MTFVNDNNAFELFKILRDDVLKNGKFKITYRDLLDKLKEKGIADKNMQANNQSYLSLLYAINRMQMAVLERLLIPIYTENMVFT